MDGAGGFSFVSGGRGARSTFLAATEAWLSFPAAVLDALSPAALFFFPLVRVFIFFYIKAINSDLQNQVRGDNAQPSNPLGKIYEYFLSPCSVFNETQN